MVKFEGEVVRLFPTILYDLDCSELIDETLEVLDKVEWSGDISKSIFILEEYEDLTKKFEYVLNKSVEVMEYILPFKMSTSWFTKSFIRSGIRDHHHSNSFLSSCFYMHDNCGFIDLYKDEFGITVPNKFPDSIKYPCKKGHMIIFPSSLKHCVESKDEDGIRYSLAMNYMPKGLCLDADSTYNYK